MEWNKLERGLATLTLIVGVGIQAMELTMIDVLSTGPCRVSWSLQEASRHDSLWGISPVQVIPYLLVHALILKGVL